MMRVVNCTCCGSKMSFLMQEKFQKGDMGVWVGNLNFTMQGGFEMAVYSCPTCGKLEFFLPEESQDTTESVEDMDLPPEAQQNIIGVSMDGVPQVRCPRCRRRHDFDYPRCPRCDYQY